MVTVSWSTDTNPPLTSSSTFSPEVEVMSTVPERSTARAGWCPGRIPMEPSAAGAEIALASPDHTVRAVASTSTLNATRLTFITQFGLDAVPGAHVILEATDVEEG